LFYSASSLYNIICKQDSLLASSFMLCADTRVVRLLAGWLVGCWLKSRHRRWAWESSRRGWSLVLQWHVIPRRRQFFHVVLECVPYLLVMMRLFIRIVPVLVGAFDGWYGMARHDKGYLSSLCSLVSSQAWNHFRIVPWDRPSSCLIRTASACAKQRERGRMHPSCDPVIGQWDDEVDSGVAKVEADLLWRFRTTSQSVLRQLLK